MFEGWRQQRFTLFIRCTHARQPGRAYHLTSDWSALHTHAASTTTLQRGTARKSDALPPPYHPLQSLRTHRFRSTQVCGAHAYEQISYSSCRIYEIPGNASHAPAAQLQPPVMTNVWYRIWQWTLTAGLTTIPVWQMTPVQYSAIDKRILLQRHQVCRCHKPIFTPTTTSVEDDGYMLSALDL